MFSPNQLSGASRAFATGARPGPDFGRMATVSKIMSNTDFVRINVNPMPRVIGDVYRRSKLPSGLVIERGVTAANRAQVNDWMRRTQTINKRRFIDSKLQSYHARSARLEAKGRPFDGE